MYYEIYTKQVSLQDLGRDTLERLSLAACMTPRGRLQKDQVYLCGKIVKEKILDSDKRSLDTLTIMAFLRKKVQHLL